MAQYEMQQENRKEDWWFRVKKRRSKKRSSLIDDLEKQANDIGASSRIQDAF